MKKLLLLVFALMLTVGCTERTNFGECIGFDDNEELSLEYEISIKNAVISAIFVETIIVPIVWALDDAKCPVGKR